MKKVISICILCLFLLVGCAHSPRPWTVEEKVAAGFFIVAHVADYYTTEKFLDNPDNWEINPVVGRHPSDKKLTIYFSLTGIAALAVGHYWPSIREYLFITYGSLNAGWAAYNTQLY